MGFKDFLSNNVGWTFNLITAHVLFWWIGFPTVIKHGYSDDNYNSKGGIPSGGEGSGEFIISLVLMCLATILYCVQFASYSKSPKE